jgi:hypothetical protein
MKITFKAGYLTMFWFIDSFYWERKDDDLGALLGDLSPVTFKDCISADPAAWEIWSDTMCKLNLGDYENKYIDDDKLPIIIEMFLNKYAGDCFDIDIIYKNLRLLKSNATDFELSKRWHNAIVKGKENPNQYISGLK